MTDQKLYSNFIYSFANLTYSGFSCLVLVLSDCFWFFLLLLNISLHAGVKTCRVGIEEGFL